jgi:2-iminobutanoate/2-iminopropanoate deaminase
MSDVFGPYTPIRQAGDLYFTSGQVGVNNETKQAAEGIESQTKQAFINLKNVLATAGLDIDNVIKTTVYLHEMEDFTLMNAVYETFFTSPRPARSTVAVKTLPKVGGDVDILVEIEAIAYKETSK